MPSTPASMPTPRNSTSTGMPMRVEKALTRMLVATRRAPMKNRLLMVLVSSIGTPST
ncbi:hypothetical protein D3C77_618990 [compost metagenome]